MSQILFATDTTPNLGDLDANFTELYGYAKNLVSDAFGGVLIGTPTALATNGDRLQIYAAGTLRAAVLKNDGGATREPLLVWNTATSGDNVLCYWATDAGLPRGSVTYNRAGGLIAYNTTSDYRAKDILGDVTGTGATIDAIQVRLARMKGATIARPMFVAHELAEVADYAVTGAKDAVDAAGAPVFQQVDVSALVPLMVAELQALRARVAALEAA